MMLTILGILRNCSFVLFDASKGPLDDNYLVEPSMTAQAALSRPGEPLTKRDIQAHQRVPLAFFTRLRIHFGMSFKFWFRSLTNLRVLTEGARVEADGGRGEHGDPGHAHRQHGRGDGLHAGRARLARDARRAADAVARLCPHPGGRASGPGRAGAQPLRPRHLRADPSLHFRGSFRLHAHAHAHDTNVLLFRRKWTLCCRGIRAPLRFTCRPSPSGSTPSLPTQPYIPPFPYTTTTTLTSLARRPIWVRSSSPRIRWNT